MWAELMLWTEWRDTSSSQAVRDATMGLYSAPRPPRSYKTWSLSVTGSPMAAKLSVSVLSLSIYSIMERDLFPSGLNSSLSCIICAFEEADSPCCMRCLVPYYSSHNFRSKGWLYPTENHSIKSSPVNKILIEFSCWVCLGRTNF